MINVTKLSATRSKGTVGWKGSQYHFVVVLILKYDDQYW